jgi:hypothetical protein
LEKHEVERIARLALKELGAPSVELTMAAIEGRPGYWRIDIQGPSGPGSLKIRCGDGTTAQWVREQIFDQYNALQ